MNIRELLEDEHVYHVACAIRGPDCPLSGVLAVFSIVLMHVIGARIAALAGAGYFGYEVRTTPVSEKDCKRLLDRARECTRGFRMAEDAWFVHYVEHLHDGLISLRRLLWDDITGEEDRELVRLVRVAETIKKMCDLAA